MFLRTWIAALTLIAGSLQWASAAMASDGGVCSGSSSPAKASAPAADCRPTPPKQHPRSPPEPRLPVPTNANFLYCGASPVQGGMPGTTTAAVSIALGSGQAASGAASAAEGESSCKRQIDLRLGKDLGLSVSNISTGQTWFALVMAFALLALALFLLKNASREKAASEASGKTSGQARGALRIGSTTQFVLGLVFAFAALACVGYGGYALGSSNSTTVLTDTQMKALQNSNALANAVSQGLANRVDDLQHRNETLEGQLAAARSSVAALETGSPWRTAWLVVFGIVLGVLGTHGRRWYDEDRRLADEVSERQPASAPASAAIPLIEVVLSTLEAKDKPPTPPAGVQQAFAQDTLDMIRNTLKRALQVLRGHEGA